MEMMVVVGFMLAFIVFSEVRNYYERKGLLDRIMSRTYTEYASHEIDKQKLKKEPEEEEMMVL